MRELHRGGLLGFFLAVAVCLCGFIGAMYIHEATTAPPPLPPLGVKTAEDALGDLSRALMRLQMNRNAALPCPVSDVFPQLLTDGEKGRFGEARDLLKQRTPPEVPFAVTAELRTTGDEDALVLCWLEEDGNAAGVIVREQAQKRTTVEETYPVFQCASESYLSSVRNATAVRNIGFYRSDPEVLTEHDPPAEQGLTLEQQGFALRWRTEGQTKDEDYWQKYMAANPEVRKTMRKPVMWISRPDRRKVSVVIYDSAGNHSEPVEVVEVGKNNTWLQ